MVSEKRGPCLAEAARRAARQFQKMKPAGNVDDYISQAPQEIQKKLQDLRSIIKSAAPNAEEMISYGMPYYRYKGRLVYFAYAKNHIGIYAIFEEVRSLYRNELKGYEMSKGTIRFPLDQPLPISLIKKLIKSQVKNRDEAKKVK